MKISNFELQKYYFGAYSFEETKEGYLQAFQYTKKQMDYFKDASDFWYDRCMASTAKTIEFTTNATQISFDFKIIWKGSEDSLELWINNLAHTIYLVKDLKDEQKVCFNLPDGNEKNIVIYLPADATCLIRNFDINGEINPPKKNGKVLWLGDSITQGFGPLRSAHTYVSVANRLLNYDILNLGIGGYVYDKKSLIKMEGYNPSKIIVSLGTNQYGTESMKDIEEYYETLMNIYGSSIPVLCITPIWRGDNKDGIPTLISFRQKLNKIVSGYKNIKIVDGFTLVPHMSEYFLDNLHPNCLGAEMYGRNLVEAIRNCDF